MLPAPRETLSKSLPHYKSYVELILLAQDEDQWRIFESGN
jgi:hypothetical protein